MAAVVQKNGLQTLNNMNHHLEMTPVTENGNSSNGGENKEEPIQEEHVPEIDIVISNVVSSFSVRCHLNLRQIALNGANVEYKRENGVRTWHRQ